MYIPALFCASCGSYIGARNKSCPACLTPRRLDQQFLAPGKPIWLLLSQNYDHASSSQALRGRPVLSDELVLFSGGDRQSSGGVLALKKDSGKKTWLYPLKNSIEGGPVISEDRVLFATWNPSGQDEDAAVYCLKLQTGEEKWIYPLPAGVWGSPIVWGLRVYVGCTDGHIYCLDISNGRLIFKWSVAQRPDRMWLYLEGGSLLAIQKQGRVSVLDALRGDILCQWQISTCDEVNSNIARWGGSFYFGSADGQIISFRLKDGRAESVLRSTEAFRATPVIADGVLYAGGKDKFLRAFDIRQKKELWNREFTHSIVTSPALVNGLVAVSVNEGRVYGIEATSGHEVWSYLLSQSAKLMTDPVVEDGVIYVGCDDGSISALPWHMGQNLWAATWLEKHGQLIAAASHYAVAGDYETCNQQSRARHYNCAIRIWRELGLRENIAHLLETQLDVTEERVANEYEDAVFVNNLNLTDPQRAANLLHRAADLYQRAEDEVSVRRCELNATRAARSAYLHVRPILLPNEWEKGEEQEVAFVVKNMGNVIAQKVCVRIAGSSLTYRVQIETGNLAAGAQVDIVAQVLPLCTGDLIIEAFHTDIAGKIWAGSFRRFPMIVKSSSVILDINGDVGMLTLYEEHMEGKIKVRGDAGLVKVQLNHNQ